uniref:Uncharacterized protein n=1 Tax=Anguilla anguilla TaxID=7936 RepID=A0A0E9P672_ANGAN
MVLVGGEIQFCNLSTCACTLSFTSCQHLCSSLLFWIGVVGFLALPLYIAGWQYGITSQHADKL